MKSNEMPPTNEIFLKRKRKKKKGKLLKVKTELMKIFKGNVARSILHR